jgi:hypothetical protein
MLNSEVRLFRKDLCLVVLIVLLCFFVICFFLLIYFWKVRVVAEVQLELVPLGCLTNSTVDQAINWIDVLVLQTRDSVSMYPDVL